MKSLFAWLSARIARLLILASVFFLAMPLYGVVTCTNCPSFSGGGGIVIDPTGACCATSTNATFEVGSPIWGVANLSFTTTMCWSVKGVVWTVEGKSGVLTARPSCEGDAVTNCWQAWLIPGTNTGTVTLVATVYCECKSPNGNASTTKRVTTSVEVCGGDDPTDGSGCSSCDGGGPDRQNAAYGSLMVGIDNGPHVQWSLGEGNSEATAGVLDLRGTAAIADFSQSSLLELPYNRPGVTRYPTNGTIQQLKSPQGLAKVVQGTNLYELQFFYLKDITGPAQDGSYSTNGTSPYVTWRVEKPSAAGTNNWLWLSEFRSGNQVRQLQYAYQAVSNKWFLTNASRVDVSWQVTSGTNTDNYHEVWSAGQLFQRAWKHYETSDSDRQLKWIEHGSGALTNRTTYSYNAVGLHELITYPDGRWTFSEYDEKHRLVGLYEPYLNTDPPAAGTPPDSATCKLTQYSYSLSDSMPTNVNYLTNAAFQITTFINNNEVAREYRMPLLGYLQIQRCATPGVGWDDANNVIEWTQYQIVTNTASGFESYTVLQRPLSRQRADGTGSVFSYADGQSSFTNLEARGELSINGQTITVSNGALIETVEDELGRPVSRTMWAVVEGATTTNILEQLTYTYQSGGQYFDELRLGYNVVEFTQGGGTRLSQFRYTCCGLDYSIDSDGIRTEYEYDAVHRPTATRRLFDIQGGTNRFIKIESVLDPIGQVLIRRRYGADNSIMTNEQSGFDVLGHRTWQVTAFGGTNTFGEGIQDNRLVRTNFFADGGSREEYFYHDGRLELVKGSASPMVRYDYQAEWDGGAMRETRTETKLNADGTASDEWTKVYLDGVGREFMTVRHDAANNDPASLIYFNSLGQRVAEVDADGVTSRFIYNGQGEMTYSGIDVNQEGNLDLDGSDRITRFDADVTFDLGRTMRRTKTYGWLTNGVDGPVLISTRENSTDGLISVNRVHDGTNMLSTTTVRTVTTNYIYTITVTNQDNSTTVSQFQYGRLVTQTRKDSSGTQLGQTTYEYDTHGRRWKSTDARNGTTVFGFNNADQITTMTTPAPGNGQASQVTSTHYDFLGRADIIRACQ
jgi:hypothetical protein